VYLTYDFLASQLTADNKKIHIQFPVTIGFDMLLPLQAFNLFPNCIFGDLSLIVKVNPNALVWSCTDPRMYMFDESHVIAQPAISSLIQTAFYSSLDTIKPQPGHWYDRRFTQVRVDGLARSNAYVVINGDYPELSQATYVSAPLRIDPDTLVTRDAESTITGFSLKDSVKQALASYYSGVPFVVPGERIVINSFSTGPTESGLNCAMTIPLNNAKEVGVLFPRNANELTTFRNIQYRGLMLTILNRNFPQKGANTNSTDFFRLEMESCNLDTILPPTQSFENSYLKKVQSIKPYRQRCTEDDTDFIMLFNLERQSSNAFFSDPVNSANETISLTGYPQVQGTGEVGSPGSDVYYYINKENEGEVINKAQPILAIVSDTFWLFSTGQRATYEIALSWNETLAKKYPEVYARLAGSS
jgi:hypothetical protein